MFGVSHQIYTKVRVQFRVWADPMERLSPCDSQFWNELDRNCMSTPAAPSRCPQNVLGVCVCVSVISALPCQNATCSSWLQLNGKLEILTIDLVVHKWLGNVSQGGGGYLTVHQPAWRQIYLTDGLSIQLPPNTQTHTNNSFFTCFPLFCFHAALSREKSNTAQKFEVYNEYRSETIRENAAKI